MYSNTGKSPRLMHYYSYWERRVFDALIKVNYVFFAIEVKGEMNTCMSFPYFIDGDK